VNQTTKTSSRAKWERSHVVPVTHFNFISSEIAKKCQLAHEFVKQTNFNLFIWLFVLNIISYWLRRRINQKLVGL
jgi:ABC-type phosphate transport system permease subunit